MEFSIFFSRYAISPLSDEATDVSLRLVKPVEGCRARKRIMTVSEVFSFVVRRLTHEQNFLLRHQIYS